MRGVRHITLVRHGETEGESSIRFHGVTDVRLSDEGRAQAAAARACLAQRSFDLVVSSSLQRARESAAIIAAGHTIELEADLREIDFGRWEGLTREEIEALDPELHGAWQAAPATFDFPQGERRADFRARVLAVLDRLLAAEQERLLIVAHKGIVRTVLEALTGAPPEQPLPVLGGVHEVERNADAGWSTRRLL